MADVLPAPAPAVTHRVVTLWRALPVVVRYGLTGGVTQLIYLGVLGGALVAGTHYLGGLVLAQLAAMSFAFPAYRGLVFNASGSWTRQVIAFAGVWWTGAAMSFIGVPALVEVADVPPFRAQLLVLVVVVTVSFVGHRTVTFRRA